MRIVGWFDALSARRTNFGANRLNGASRYRSQRSSGSIVCRSLSITLNPCFMAWLLLPRGRRLIERDDHADAATCQGGSRLRSMRRVATVLALTALVFFLGIRHATDADHVLAVSTIVSRQGTLRGGLLVSV